MINLIFTRGRERRRMSAVQPPHGEGASMKGGLRGDRDVDDYEFAAAVENQPR